MTATVLVGDIGGTYARFAVAERKDERQLLGEEITLSSRAFGSLAEALEELLALAPAAREASTSCFAIAGPVRDNRSTATNLPWVVDGDALADLLQLPSVTLLNDLEAAAWGVDELASGGLSTLRAGVDGSYGHRALLAPGTGLGQATLFWDGQRHLPYASEGGHGDFAPANELQVELWRHLAARYGHVSWERVLSGPGLDAIYRFLLEREGERAPDWLKDAERHGDAAAEISTRGRDGSCARARRAVDLFVEVLAAEAGNLALRTLASGGVYLAGGMAPKLAEELHRPAFLETFSAKGRFRGWLETVPIHLVTDERVGLRGAAARALRATLAA